MLIAWGSTLLGLSYGGMTVQKVGDAFANFGFSVPLPAFGTVFSGFEYPRHHPGHRDPVRHLRPGRGDGQCRERGSRGRLLSDHARAHRRRRGQPDRLPDGQSVHQRGLYRPSRLEGDGRPHRLFGGDRRDGDRAVLVRHHRADVVAHPAGRDLADPALHRHADRRAGVPGNAEEPRARDRARARAAPCRLGQGADRRRARRRPAPAPPRSGSTSSDRSACSITGSKCCRAARSSAASCSARSRCSSSRRSSSRRRRSRPPAPRSPSSASCMARRSASRSRRRSRSPMRLVAAFLFALEPDARGGIGAGHGTESRAGRIGVRKRARSMD